MGKGHSWDIIFKVFHKTLSKEKKKTHNIKKKKMLLIKLSVTL
jgi:hypothetical protein